MAVIGKIRERSGLLIVLVGGALALFILDALLSNRGGPTGRGDDPVGEIAGEQIKLGDFDRRVSDEVESYRNEFGQPANAQVSEQVRNTVWNEIVKARVLLDQVEAAGFTITKAEYDDVRFGDNVAPDFRGQFSGPDGQPDKTRLREYFSSIQINAPVYHEIQSRRIQENRLYAKFNTLVKKSVYVNSAQARDEFNAKNTRATFSFVAKRYDSEPDSLYPVSDKDLRRYYNEHKNDSKHKQKASRTFDYVLFPVLPSDQDREALARNLTALRGPFEQAEDDSAFVLVNAESRAYNKVPYTEGSIDKLNDSLIVNGEVGAVVGPFLEGNTYKLVKVKELAGVPEARVRHILLSTQKGKDEDEQKKRADSLLTVVKRDKSKFEAMVTKFSDDPGSVSNGGVYEWFGKEQMVPEFTKASFDEKVGATTICKTSYGFHIVEVLGQRNRQERRIITVDRSVKPSPATFNEVYKRANEFSLRNKTPETLKAAAAEQGLQVTNVPDFRADSRYVQGLSQPGNLIGWVNRAKLNEVSEPTDAGDNYVVAALLKVKEEGVPELDDVREAFTKEAAKQKKAEAWVEKMKGKTDLNALAGELGSSVQDANDMAFNNFSIPGGYAEYEVIGKIFGLQAGQASVPLKGETAVFVAQMNSRNEAPADGDIAGEKGSLLGRLQSRAENAVLNALREAAGVKDNRHLHYN